MVFATAVTTGPLTPFANLKQSQLKGTQGEGEGSVGRHHWGMLINLDTCIGCEYCQRACSATNDVPVDMPWNTVVASVSSTGRRFYAPRPCLHCQEAPCVEICPVKATYVRPDGLVVMDYGPTFEIHPQLAEKWDITPDAKVYTLAQDPENDGKDGLLDQPCEVLIRGIGRAHFRESKQERERRIRALILVDAVRMQAIADPPVDGS